MRPNRLPVAITAAALAAAVALSGTTAPADAGPPGTWSVISGGGLTNIIEPGMYRTADGTLHVAIVRGNSYDTESIDVAHVSESGQLLGRTEVIPHWSGVTADPELVGSPSGGLRLVFGGHRTVEYGEPYNEGQLYWAESDPTGTVWTLASHTTPANAGITGYVSSGTGVATLPDGTLVTAYPMNSDVYYQVGAGPVQTWSSGECCVYDMTLAYDNGVVWAAWSNNGTTPSTRGLFVRTIYPTLGPVIKAPKSTSKDGYASISQGAAFAARNGGGTYFAYCVGYPFCDTVVLWQVGSSQVLKVPESADAAQVAMSAAPSGRLWIGWASEADEVYAVRTNTKANGFGAVRHLPAPKKSQGVYDLFIEGTRARADIVFNDEEAIWHQQVFVGLTLKAEADQWFGSHAEKIGFKVTDAGDGVQGATVKAKWNGNKLTCKTAANGKCTITFPKMGKNKIKVSATKAGYAPDETKLKVN